MRRETCPRRLTQVRPRVDWRAKAREAVGLGFICLAAFSFMSLLSFDSRDSRTIEWSAAQAHAFNKGGRLGAWIAENLLGAFGVTAYVALGLLAFWGVMILVRRSYHDAAAKAVGVLLFQAGCSALAALETTPAFLAGEFARSALLRSMGGSYGELGRDLLVAYFGIVGSYLVLLLVLSISCLLATDWMVYLALLRIWTLLRAGYLVGRSVVEAAIDTAVAFRRARAEERLSLAGAGGADLGYEDTGDLGAHPLMLQPIGAAKKRVGFVRTFVPAPTPHPDSLHGPHGTRVARREDFCPESGVVEPETGASSPRVDDGETRTGFSRPALAPAESAGQPSVRSTREALERALAEVAEETDQASGPARPSSEPDTRVDLHFAGPLPAEQESEAEAAPELETPACGPAADEVSADTAPPPGARRPVQSETEAADGADEGGGSEVEPEPEAAPRARHRSKKMVLPPTSLLEEVKVVHDADIETETRQCKQVIETALRTFGIEAEVVEWTRGPVITRYELILPDGVRVGKVQGLVDDLTVKLKVSSVRVVYPIPGKNTIGIEVPNALRETVRLKELMDLNRDRTDKMGIPLFFGKDATGEPLVTDLADMPHLLVSGTTGAGKSVCLNTLIMSLLLTRSPDDLKMILIDPKTTELAFFRDVPHLMAPVVTEPKRAPVVLGWVIKQMEERYHLFTKVGVKKIDAFNALGPKKIRERVTEPGEEPPDVPTHMPYLVVIVDELADLMMVAGKEVETAVTRIAQKARAAGIHLVLATQRPSVDVITGLIKANMPARVAFRVASKIDSRTILDRNGAERLLGKGDMLVFLNGASDATRAQCTFVSDGEIKDVVDHLRPYGPPVFDDELLDLSEAQPTEEVGDDPLFEQAVQITLEAKRGSVSLLQRKLEVGFARAGRLMDMMERAGVVESGKGSKAREVLMTPQAWEARHVAAGSPAEAELREREDAE